MEHHAETGFVSALVSAVMRYVCEETQDLNDKEAADKEKEMIEQYKPVLQQFLQNHHDLQLVAVYALQVFCFSRGFPKGLLLRWFVALYEADVVDEHAFIAWKEDVNDSYPGKGKALFQVNQWLTWLEEAESEEEEEDE
jgi:translation initiation factor 4G